MNDETRNRLLSELIEQPPNRESVLRDADAADQVELTALAQTADLLWLANRGAPALADDPVAAMLGLIPDSACVLAPAALTQARKRAGLTVSQLAERLAARGWKVKTGDVFRWETRSADEVAPALVQAVAEVLGVSVDAIRKLSAAAGGAELAAIRQHPTFQGLVARWAKVRSVPAAVAAAALESRLLATVHRGDQPDTEQMLASLSALVSSVEQAAPKRNEG
jgi:transcriptional regulator with XRE-family HTH domain